MKKCYGCGGTNITSRIGYEDMALPDGWVAAVRATFRSLPRLWRVRCELPEAGPAVGCAQ
jgi:hypothetical protein